MDTVSLLVSHHVHAARHVLLLVALASIALGLLAAAGLVLDLPSPHPATDPSLAPIRWRMVAGSLA